MSSADIFSYITGGIAMLGLCWSILSAFLPSTRMKKLEEVLEDTEDLLRKTDEEGFIPNRIDSKKFSLQLLQSRKEMEHQKRRIRCLTTLSNEVMEMLRGFSSTIAQTITEVKHVRVEIITISEMERRKLQEICERSLAPSAEFLEMSIPLHPRLRAQMDSTTISCPTDDPFADPTDIDALVAFVVASSSARRSSTISTSDSRSSQYSRTPQLSTRASLNSESADGLISRCLGKIKFGLFSGKVGTRDDASLPLVPKTPSALMDFDSALQVTPPGACKVFRRGSTEAILTHSKDTSLV